MASNHTQNYGLNQWISTDKVLCAEFNADNAAIDTALAENRDAITAARSDLTSQITTVRSQAATNLAAAKTELTNKIAAVQATVPTIVTGTYTGDNAESRLVSLGFTPKAVYVSTDYGTPAIAGSNYFYGGLALQAGTVVTPSGSTVLSIESGGFRVYYATTSVDRIRSNENGKVYYYIAFV